GGRGSNGKLWSFFGALAPSVKRQFTRCCRRGAKSPPRAQHPICLSGDACVLGSAERAGNALYGARVDLKFGGGLPHAHAPRQSRPNPFSQLLRDRWPAESLTFTLGPQ